MVFPIHIELIAPTAVEVSSVMNDIPSKELRTIIIPVNRECVEINLLKRNGVICGFHNPHKNQIENHILFLSKSLDYYLS